jgi:lon-related putative ATP-dependent protease
MTIEPLEPSLLYRPCEAVSLPFESTDDLEDPTEIFGQERAATALRFALAMPRGGYNVFAMGPSGQGRHTLVRAVLGEAAESEEPPPDWCYVHNFEDSHRPVALRLPSGRARQFASDVAQLIDELKAAIPAALDSEEFRARHHEVQQELEDRHNKSLRELQERAEDESIALVRSPSGFVFAPMVNGEVLSPDDFNELEKEERERLEQTMDKFESELQVIARELPRLKRESRRRTNELKREFTSIAIDQLFDEIQMKYEALDPVRAYLEAVERNVLDHCDDFLADRSEGDDNDDRPPATPKPEPLRRYRVNVVVDHRGKDGAPVIYEDNPTFANLFGRVEHRAQFGALVTDFSQIKPGALHQANGGYLLIDAEKVLTEQYAWDGLKRALRSREIRVESARQRASVMQTTSLDPEPIPLDVKVVLLGERIIYYSLYAGDLDFDKLFKVIADFDETVERTDENALQLARLIARLARDHALRPLTRGAVMRVIEHAARLAADAERLSTHRRSFLDLLSEADYFAGRDGCDEIDAEHVHAAIEAAIQRSDRPRELSHEEIRRGTLRIDTRGDVVGQVNGLAVVGFGPIAFGQPTRITAQARLGRGEVVDIMRESDLGGAIHSKGVLILASFLAARYAKNRPLSLSASLVFEQSYSAVDGDSASLAELCALLSALADIPLKQTFAVTGSVDQKGRVQAIGGVNEKVEGFYDVCHRAELTGDQAVIIPRDNTKNLMLRHDVVAAAEDGLFSVYAVETVDDAIELLTGCAAGRPDERGTYPEGSVNRRVDDRLAELLEIRRSLRLEGDHLVE